LEITSLKSYFNIFNAIVDKYNIKKKQEEELKVIFTTYLESIISEIEALYKNSINQDEDHFNFWDSQIFNLESLINSDIDNKDILFLQLLKLRQEKFLKLVSGYKEVKKSEDLHKLVSHEINSYIKNKLVRNIFFYNQCISGSVFEHNNTIKKLIDNDYDINDTEVVIEGKECRLTSLLYNKEQLENIFEDYDNE
jgi:hypothetical protein